MNKIYEKIISGQKKKKAQLAVLVDPDKFDPELIQLADSCGVDYFFVGGSELARNNLDLVVSRVKKLSKIPVVIFPGDETQLSAKADAVLFLSLLSGRNPDYLIGKQVLAAPLIKRKKLQSISTAYLLIGKNNRSATRRVTNTKPLDEKDSASIVNTCLAAELLGFKVIYLEAGSGAKNNVKESLIRKVKRTVSLPLIIGGGINSVSKVKNAIKNGADIVVVGNALEKNKFLIKELSSLFIK
ncbi:MAG: phosphoglycerol geranylgeranyltransferase [Bacteroidia bacterium]